MAELLISCFYRFHEHSAGLHKNAHKKGTNEKLQALHYGLYLNHVYHRKWHYKTHKRPQIPLLVLQMSERD